MQDQKLLPESIRNLNDKAWLELLIKSVDNPYIDGVHFPTFPSNEVQSTFVGSSNKEALEEAYKFYVLVKEYSKKLHKPLDSNSRFLDFGCGWGRFLRFFGRILTPITYLVVIQTATSLIFVNRQKYLGTLV